MRLWRAFALFLLVTCGAAAQAVEQWDVFEVELRGPADGNPFVDVQLSARFSDGTQTIEVDGFYDGDGSYRLRFMPPHAGRWTWVTQSNRWPLTNKQGEFSVTPARAGNHGPFLIDSTKTILGRYGPDSYSWERIEKALKK